MFAKTQIGSPYYVSPEMWKNKPYNSKTDMWAIGCFLYELVANRNAFRAESMTQLHSRIRKANITPFAQSTSAKIKRAVTKALTVDVSDRPDAAAVTRGLIDSLNLTIAAADGLVIN